MAMLTLEGTRAIVDLSKSPYEFGSPEFLNLHLKDLATIETPITTIRYEEEIIIELDEPKTRTLVEYTGVVRQIEGILLKQDIYGMKEDPAYNQRKDLLRKFYEYVYMNPVMASRILEDYKEPEPEKSMFLQGAKTFRAWVNGILKRYKATALYNMVKKTGDLRTAFLSIVGLKSLYFIESILLDIPPNAVPLKDPDASYKLDYGISVQIYEVPGDDAFLYVQSNPVIENLSDDLKKLLKHLISEQMKETFQQDPLVLFDLKSREYRQYFLDYCVMNNIRISAEEAQAMGREAACWVVGMGAPIENLALDRNNVSDIYIDSENSPLYIEQAKFGLCHTLYRYNREMLEYAFRNIVLTTGGTRKFDDNNPILDVVLNRSMMRCHLQRPPATFGELQGALRIMKEEPFTYSEYLYFRSMNPFFVGYDDVLVGLGSSEAVLGLKGVGKTAFTAAKISSIGTRRRIIPIQDIEEIPVRAFRKRGFHIGAARVQSSDVETTTTKELDLVSMANALLRMGDAALIINEVRSRVAVQGIINLLNTQPGVFLLYNLHAESIKDVQDRLELVFGIPAASMFATDRYSFLKKVRFGRRGRIYRVLGYEYETDQEQKKFVETFHFKRGNDIDSCILEPKFLRNAEAQQFDFDKVDVGKMEGELDIAFIPPVLTRRCEETGIPPEQFMLQSFFKGKVYYDIYKSAVQLKNKHFMQLDFVVKVNTDANKLLASLEKENGEVDFKEAWKQWGPKYKELLKQEIAEVAAQAPSASRTAAPKAEPAKPISKSAGDRK
ncbi:MAG: ATPase, T2SS/T4P/T4SS family [Candidatus Bilamarchaeaceae archaeon]